MTDKIQIGIQIVLPAVPNAQDACVRRLTDLLAAKHGINAAHLIEASGDRPGQICIHFDKRIVSVGEIRALARQAGATLEERFGHLLVKSAPMHARRARSLETRLEAFPGVVEAAISPDGVVRVEFDRREADVEAITDRLRVMGLVQAEEERVAPAAVTKEPHPEKRVEEHSHVGVFGHNTELLFAVLSGTLLLVGWLLSVLTGISARIPWGCYVAAYFFGGFFTTREAFEKVLSGRFEIDFLMIVAAIGAAALGEWAEGALLLFLFSLGHALEHYAMGRARRAIAALGELAPETALVRRGSETTEVAVDQLQRGDVVIVKPNERIPADGFVIKGKSSVNQAPITGESVPVDKRPVDDPRRAAIAPERLSAEQRVFAGTINQSGALEIQVTKRSSETTLARVVEMVSEAETQKSPTQQFTDRFERYFVPSVLGLVVMLLFAWVVVDEPFSDSFYRAMAVLVAASPCALAISTPSAVLSGIARAARGGVLAKGGAPLENLGRLRAIAFDKTGTLTEGKPRLVDVVSAESVPQDELLTVAIAVERLSDHPLAAAVVRDGTERLGVAPSEAHDLQSITGRGVRAQVDSQPVHIGKAVLFDEIEGPPLPETLRKSVEDLEANGRTTMVVRKGNRYLGVLGLMDTPRRAAREMVQQLRELGIDRMIMISGDNQPVADAVAQVVGIDEAWGDLMPEDKVQSIKKLRREQHVAMVGDGVNDAPAMANATVGIAMGAAGSDVALETADVALMADDLNQLPFSVGLSRRTSRIIRQNLWLSLGMVTILIPSTLFGLRIGPAVALHEGSTLIVVFNALRLLTFRSPNAVPRPPES